MLFRSADDAYSSADSAEDHAKDASGYASRASDAISTALEELAAFQPFDSDELERLMEIQFALLELVQVNARRINSLVEGNATSYREGMFLRSLHNWLLKLYTRDANDIYVYSVDKVEFHVEWPETGVYGKALKMFVDKKEENNG